MKTILSYKNEELLNTISHALGAVLSIVGLYFLLKQNTGKTPYAVFSIAVYSSTLISMFSTSAIYHLVTGTKLKRGFRVLDHINIYLLIAGTYTPVALITLINGNGWTIFNTVWVIAALGTLFKIFYTGKLEFLSLVLYVAMGWLIVFDFSNLVTYMAPQGIRLLFLGGAFYTLGIIFYAVERIPFNHFIWHIFVLGGTIIHWFTIYNYVI